MTSILYVHDERAQLFHTPFYAHNNAVGERYVELLINSGTHEFSGTYADLKVYAIGEFNPHTGEIALFETPELIARGVDLKRNDVTPADQLRLLQGGN